MQCNTNDLGIKSCYNSRCLNSLQFTNGYHGYPECPDCYRCVYDIVKFKSSLYFNLQCCLLPCLQALCALILTLSTIFTYLNSKWVASNVHHLLNLDESYSYNSNPVGYTSTSEYKPAQTTYISGSGVNQPYSSNYYATGTQQPVASNTYTTTTQYVSGGQQQYVSGGQQVQQGGYVSSGSNAQRVVAEDIPVESRIEYIPFEKKYIEYDKV